MQRVSAAVWACPRGAWLRLSSESGVCQRVSIHHALRFVLQLPDGRILGSFCSGIRFGLAGERSFLPGKRTGAGLGHLIVNRPCGRTIAAVEVKTVILRVTACGNGLRCGRSHLPAAAVHAAAGPAGRNGNDRPVHLFQRVQLNLVGVDSECQIKAAAGTLRRSCPCSGIILRFWNTRHIRDLGAARNFFTDQRHNLPRIPCGRVIDVGVVAVFPGLCIRLYKGEDIGIRVPAIIDKELFDRVQIQVGKNKCAPARNKPLNDQYLLTTKLFCAQCGSTMSGISGISKNGSKYQYYSCTNRSNKKGCTKRYIGKEVLEAAVVDTVKKVLLANNIPELAKAVVKCCNDAQDNGNLLKLESELREVNKGINNLLDLIEAGRNSQAMADRLEQREQQKKLLEQNIAKEKVLHRIPTEDEVIFFFNNFIQGNIDSLEYNRYLIDILVNSIYLSDEEDGTQKMTVLLNTQNGQETVTLNDLTQCSSNVHMVHHRGLEPRTH